MAAPFQKSIRKGLSALEAMQKPKGEFLSLWSFEKDMSQPTAFPSPFNTAMVLDLIRDLPGIDPIRTRGLQYLASIRPPSGWCCFFQEGIDPDLDDTAMINLALQAGGDQGIDHADMARRIRARAQADGRYMTWLRPDPQTPNEYDPCVSVNALRYLLYNGIDSPLGWLSEDLRKWKAGQDTISYVQPYFLLHFASQLPRKVREAAFRETHMAARVAQGTHVDLLDAALRLSVAATMGMDKGFIKALSGHLLAGQMPDGTWPDRGAYQGYNYWGGPCISTAASIHALHKASLLLADRKRQ